ncbi:hypothetical protein PR202_gb06554 [Eleusine coracana subsp. coracana]|uniref:Uncharacterized protein n=1 Tax=Eleusine coracana subsp. coracana TaxID=191504 RepID=A0AAV5E9W8_ELECO|nr:hypothetical protein PR202_gb06554 [Eleusine coracana subsp. coracana]
MRILMDWRFQIAACPGASPTARASTSILFVRPSSSTTTSVGICLRVVPSEHNRAANHTGFLNIVAAEMKAPFEHLPDDPSLNAPSTRSTVPPPTMRAS